MTEHAVATIEQAQTALDMKSQVQRIQEVMSAVMKNGTHYGTIPGCGQKPALLKPGAEKLMMTFRLAVSPKVLDLSTPTVTRYRVLTDITAQSTGLYLGTGVGECSSDEEKYAWRKAVCKEEWDEADPENRRSKWAHGKNGTAYQVNQIRTNPSDVANTVLKMAKKRSLVDGVLTVTGASDIFSQDLDETEEQEPSEPPADPNEQKLEQAKKAKPDPAATTQGRQANDAVLPIAFDKNGMSYAKGTPLSDVTEEHLSKILDYFEYKLEKDPNSRYASEWKAMITAICDEAAARA